ncbi:MAG: hypothetical protein RSC24_06325 [Clostridium sp.]
MVTNKRKELDGLISDNRSKEKIYDLIIMFPVILDTIKEMITYGLTMRQIEFFLEHCYIQGYPILDMWEKFKIFRGRG